MQHLEVRARGFELTQAIGEHCAMCFQKTFSWGAGQIRGAAVILREINDDIRGGTEKSCRVVIRLTQGASMMVEAVDEDLYRAIAVASTRMCDVLHQRVGRIRKHRMRHGRAERRDGDDLCLHGL